MASVPRPRFTTVALSLLPLVLLACGSISESTGTGFGSAGTDEEIPAPSKPHSGAGETAQCTPSVVLDAPIALPLSSFECPAGWEARARSNAPPTSGRFTNAREMVDALCTESTDSATTSSKGELSVGIDFDANDVVAVPYNGEIALHRRAGELWIRHTESCEPAYRTALFIVPKYVVPREQTCTSPCP